MTWRRQKETDHIGRTGYVYLRDRWEISDEGPAPWTVFERTAQGYRYRSEHQTLKQAKEATSEQSAEDIQPALDVGPVGTAG